MINFQGFLNQIGEPICGSHSTPTEVLLEYALRRYNEIESRLDLNFGL